MPALVSMDGCGIYLDCTLPTLKPNGREHGQKTLAFSVWKCGSNLYERMEAQV
jgi:hypothetical protein